MIHLVSQCRGACADSSRLDRGVSANSPQWHSGASFSMTSSPRLLPSPVSGSTLSPGRGAMWTRAGARPASKDGEGCDGSGTHLFYPPCCLRVCPLHRVSQAHGFVPNGRISLGLAFHITRHACSALSTGIPHWLRSVGDLRPLATLLSWPCAVLDCERSKSSRLPWSWPHARIRRPVRLSRRITRLPAGHSGVKHLRGGRWARILRVCRRPPLANLGSRHYRAT